MLVFIDESGDAGFKVDSSHNLTMSMVVFENYDHADFVRAKISELSKSLRAWPEFKYAHTRKDIRKAFFEAIRADMFRMRGIVVAKKTVYSHFLRNNPEKFYNFVLKQMLEKSGIQGAQVRIDGNSNKSLLKAARVYLRREMPDGMIKNLKFCDSCAEPLIQLADMVTGAIARAHLPQPQIEAQGYCRLLAPKTENLWIFS